MRNGRISDVAEVHRRQGPILLLAGPGTGKTYQLGKRIKYLVEECSQEPATITVITFTAAAAANMRQRISDPRKRDLYVPADLQPRHICTMHSLGYRIVRENAELLSLPEHPEVVTSDFTRDVLLRDATQLVGQDRSASSEPCKCRQYGRCVEDDSPKCAVCRKYRELLAACGAIDYDDQVLLACRLLEQHPEVAEQYQRQTQHLLVDEYQDVNAGQSELVRRITTGQESGLFAVGDDDQSIYSWRGGSPEFIREFPKHFGPAAEIVPLLISWRCPETVLEGALSVVVASDKNRIAKGQFAYRVDQAPKITIHNVPSDKAEARIISTIVKQALPDRDVLILVPGRRYAALIADQLRRLRVRFAAAEPAPGEGLPLFNRLAAWLGDRSYSLALRDCIEAYSGTKGSGVPSRKVRKPERREERNQAFLKISSLWNAVLSEGWGLWESLKATPEDPLLNRIRTVFEGLQDHDKKQVGVFLAEAAAALEPWKSTTTFLEEIEGWVARGVASDREADINVRIMTFQGAKGLEADLVCVVGLEDDTLPRKGTEGEELAEQARLLYVSMTRAKKELHLFHARSRSGAVSYKAVHGADGTHVLRRSPFLDSIPGDYAEIQYHKSKVKK